MTFCVLLTVFTPNISLSRYSVYKFSALDPVEHQEWREVGKSSLCVEVGGDNFTP